MISLSHKIGFKAKRIIRDKEGHFLVIKGSVHQVDITITNGMHQITASKHIKQNLTELEGGDKPIIAVGDFNTPVIVLIEQADE